MRISAFFVPFFSLIAGIAGFYLRLTELWNIFDSHTGLPERNADITLALIAFSAVFLFLILLFSIRVASKHKAQSGFDNAYGTDSLSYPLIISGVGIIWIIATVKHILDLIAAGPLLMPDLYFSILSGLAALSTIFFAVEMFQDPRRKLVYALSMVPTVFMCFWLINLYRQNASNPILLSYSYMCLAVISAALGFYFTSGFVYKKPAPGKTIFAYSATIYFCFVALADDYPLTIKIIIASIIAVNLVYSSKLIRHMRWKSSGAPS